jgi:ATP-dependent protease ClpP protease subunit
MKKVIASSDTKIMPFMEPNKLFVTEYHDHIRYDYYLVGEIGNPEEYMDLCHALRSCSPADEFFLRLNSGGGQVRTGNQIINAIHECPATTIGFIEHDCGSMCTFLFLACDTWGVSKYAEWFSHTVSGGNWGKESETFEASQFLRRQTHARVREEYSNFLTPDEIDSLLKGADYYFNADEIMERLEVFDEARQAQGCGVEGCTECGEQEEMVTIDTIVENAVAKALDAHQKKIDNAAKRSATAAKKAPKVIEEK